MSTGSTIARDLSKYNLKTCVLENRCTSETSKANSGIVHAGEDPTPGTLKAKMNVTGNEMFDKLKEEFFDDIGVHVIDTKKQLEFNKKHYYGNWVKFLNFTWIIKQLKKGVKK